VEGGLLRAVLETLEPSGGDVNLRPALALLAGREIQIEEAELNAARRRALLLLAAGGDPQQGLDLDGRAVRALADDLEQQARRDHLAAGLAAVGEESKGLPFVSAAVESLLADPDLGWRAFACALLAEDLAD
jgi:hypothetical protein